MQNLEQQPSSNQQRKKLHREKWYTYAERALFFFWRIVQAIAVESFNSLVELFKTKEPKSIDGQLALVTGGGNGLGKEICVELAKHGCNVAVVDIDLPGATKLAEQLKTQYGVKTKAYKVDVSSYEEIESLKGKIEKDLGIVDILINNAGLTPTQTLEECSVEYIRKIIDVNLVSNIWTVKLFVEGMKEKRRGHIVQIASMAGLQGIPISSVYSATKFGVRGFMESLFADMITEDLENEVFTTTVYPYFIATNQDLCDFLDKNKSLHLFPAYSPSYVAKTTVDGMLKNTREIAIPGFLRWGIETQKLYPRNVLVQLLKIFYESSTFYKKKLLKQRTEAKLTNGTSKQLNGNTTKQSNGSLKQTNGEVKKLNVAPTAQSENLSVKKVVDVIQTTKVQNFIHESEEIVEKLAEKVVENVLGKVVEKVVDEVVNEVGEQ